MAELSPADIPLQLAGETLDFFGIDFQITLRFSNGASLSFESNFELQDDTERTLVDPELHGLGLLALLKLHTQEVASAALDGDVLVLEFENGVVLRAGPDERYESWHYAGPERPPVRMMALPGGEVAFWGPVDEAEPDPKMDP